MEVIVSSDLKSTARFDKITAIFYADNQQKLDNEGFHCSGMSIYANLQN